MFPLPSLSPSSSLLLSPLPLPTSLRAVVPVATAMRVGWGQQPRATQLASSSAIVIAAPDFALCVPRSCCCRRQCPCVLSSPWQWQGGQGRGSSCAQHSQPPLGLGNPRLSTGLCSLSLSLSPLPSPKSLHAVLHVATVRRAGQGRWLRATQLAFSWPQQLLSLPAQRSCHCLRAYPPCIPSASPPLV